MGATALIVATVVSSVAAAAGGVMSYMQGSSQAAMARRQAAASQQQAEYARAMAFRNQQQSEYAAQASEKKGQYEAGLVAERQRKLLGRQLALTGASGADIYGSPLEVMGQSWAEGTRDKETVLYNAAYDAWKYRTSGETSILEGTSVAGRYGTQADIYNLGAGAASTSGMMGLIGGIGSAGSSIITGYDRYDYSKRGGLTLNPNVLGSGGRY